MLSGLPSSLGYPEDSTQANYYPGNERLTRDEIAYVYKILEMHNIEPENTRVTKTTAIGKKTLHVLQASVNSGCLEEWKDVDEKQVAIIDCYIDSFRSGSLTAYRESQKLWVTDKSPILETILGFVEPYRDPHGVRGEWESIVCISDPIETSRLKRLVDKSDTFIRLLSWAVPELNAGKGPFEKDLFEAPDFASVHGL